MPGSILQRFEGIVSIIDEIGSGDNNNRKHVPFTQNVVLQPDTAYWIGLASTTAAPFAQMGLPFILKPGTILNPPGDGQMAHFVNGELVGLSGFTHGDMAFRLHGQLLGDADANQQIDGADFLAWQRLLGATGLAAYAQADFSGDGQVADDDLPFWRVGFGAAIDLQSHQAMNAVPSPSSMASISVAVVGLGIINRARMRKTGRHSRHSRERKRDGSQMWMGASN